MLLALLYANDGLLAAAPACDQRVLGHAYWYDVLGLELDHETDYETAYVAISEKRLVTSLLEDEFKNAEDAAEAVDDYLGLPSESDSPLIVYADN